MSESLQKLDGAWRTMVNSYELNKIVATVIAALPGVLFLLEQISVASGPWHTAIDLMTTLLHRNHKGGSETAHILILWNG